MKCPCCGNEMQSGFVRAMGRGGVCWVTENRPMGAAVGCPGFLLLGKAPHSETDHVPAQRCAACRMVTIGLRRAAFLQIYANSTKALVFSGKIR